MADIQTPSDFELGKEYYNRGDHQEAVKCFIRGAKQRCPNSTAWLASCYQNGKGIERDLTKAKELYASSYFLWKDRRLRKEQWQVVQQWIPPQLEALKDVEECTTISQFVPGIGMVRVIKSDIPYDTVKVRRNKYEVVVKVAQTDSLLYGIGFLEQKVTNDWVCDNRDNHYYDGYTINADLIHLQVKRGTTDLYTSIMDGRDCVVQFPKDACLDYLYVQKTIHKHVKDLILQRAQVAIPPVLANVSERIGVPYRKCEVIRSHARYVACNYAKGNKIVFVGKCVQLPIRSLEALCVHELTHNFVLGHTKCFYDKMIELAGREIFLLDAHLWEEKRWPYVRMGR